MKRVRQDWSESSNKKARTEVQPPKHYKCPEGRAFIETQGRRYQITVLLNSGSNIFLLNQQTAQRLNIPTVIRDKPILITTFDGESAPTGGEQYTHPFLLEIGTNGHRSKISCEIANAGKYDLIIPFGWWNTEHPITNIENPKE